MMRSLPAQAGLFQAAERRPLIGCVTGVDPDNAELKRLADTPYASIVLREKVGGESVFRTVSKFNGFPLVLEAKMGATGPNVSSRAIFMSWVPPAITVGLKK